MASQSAEDRIGHWMQTFTSNKFWPLDPRREEIHIEDIAHSLAMQCRFAGHCKCFYSVAEHSVKVSLICDPEDALWGLLHDASEAYLVDLPRPVKRHSRIGDEYQRIEAMLQEEIALRYGLPVDEPESVKIADKVLLGVEAQIVMDPLVGDWSAWLALAESRGRQVNLDLWEPESAEYRFLERFRELGGIAQ